MQEPKNTAYLEKLIIEDLFGSREKFEELYSLYSKSHPQNKTILLMGKILRDTNTNIPRLDYLAQLSYQLEPLKEDYVQIYQLSGDNNNLFCDYNYLKKQNLSPDYHAYDFVYMDALTPDMTLDDIYTKFNISKPEDFKGHSLSVSDVIVLGKDGIESAYFVDSFGFQEIPEFVQVKQDFLEYVVENFGYKKEVSSMEKENMDMIITPEDIKPLQYITLSEEHRDSARLFIDTMHKFPYNWGKEYPSLTDIPKNADNAYLLPAVPMQAAYFVYQFLEDLYHNPHRDKEAELLRNVAPLMPHLSVLASYPSFEKLAYTFRLPLDEENFESSYARSEIVNFYVESVSFLNAAVLINDANTISYKGIVFDDWTIDAGNHAIYGEMCEACAEKYKNVLSEELTDGGVGACSVKGCDEVGMDNDYDSHYYVDFKPELIQVHEYVKNQKQELSSLDNLVKESNEKKEQQKPANKKFLDSTLSL